MHNISTSWLRRSGRLFGIAILAISGVWGASAGTSLAQESECWAEAPDLEAGYPQWSEPPAMVIDTGSRYEATIETNRGNIVIELAAGDAPNAVNNFVCLARAGYYEVTVFHRVIAGFMVQGGDPTGTGAGGPGYQFEDELPSGDAPYTKGAIAMANAGANTNGSQFFIVQADQPAEFPANYSIFGQVTEGLDVLDTIAAVPVGPNAQGSELSRPQVTLGVKTITILEDGSAMSGQPAADSAAAQSTPESGSATPAASDSTPETSIDPEVAETADVETDGDDGNLALWVTGGAVIVIAAGYGVYRATRRTAA